MGTYMPTVEQKREYQKRYREKHPDRIKAAKKKSQAKHAEKRNAERRAYRAANREKLDAAKKAWAAANPELVAMQRVRKRIKRMNDQMDTSLRHHYDITLAEYEEIFAAQGGVCAICKKFEVTSRVSRLVVDHDHKTGKIRALLCHRCNCGLGYFKDNLTLVARALAYLEAFNADACEHGDGGVAGWASRVRSVLGRVSEERGQEVRAEVLGPAEGDGKVDGLGRDPAARQEVEVRRARASIHPRLLVVA